MVQNNLKSIKNIPFTECFAGLKMIIIFESIPNILVHIHGVPVVISLKDLMMCKYPIIPFTDVRT